MPANKRSTYSDLTKVDAYENGPADYEEIPELTEEDFANGVFHVGGVPLARGRPKSASSKVQVTLRLDREIVERFRAEGPGWQTRINETLRKAAGV